VPATVGAFVDTRGRCRVQRRAECRCCQRGAADQHRQDGIVLVRHGRRAATAALAQLADLRAARHGDVVGDVRIGVAAADERIPGAGDHRTRGVPRRRGRESDRRGQHVGETDGGVGGSGEFGGGGESARRAARLHRQRRQGGHDVGGVQHAGQPVGRLETHGARQRRLRQRAGQHRVTLERLDQGGEDADLFGDVGGDAGECLAQAEHQRGVDDVLAGETAVHPPGRSGRGPFAQQRHQRGDGVAVALGRGGQGGDVGVVDYCRQVGARLEWRDPVVDEHCEPGVFDGHQSAEEAAVAEEVAGPLVARPEQVGHGRWPG
jgi:hypothetical protein